MRGRRQPQVAVHTGAGFSVSVVTWPCFGFLTTGEFARPDRLVAASMGW